MRKIPLLGWSLLLLLLAYWWGLPPFPEETYKGPLRMGDLVDQYAIVQGLLRTKSFSDTWAWWTGPWVGYWGDGQINAFYRPLTSLVWYTQYRIWGPNGAVAFMWMHRFWHLIVCLLAVAFFRRVLGYGIALAAVALWASNLTLSITFPGPRAALFWWKDDPDLWISISIILALWSLLSYWRTSKPHFLSGAVLFQLVGIAFKEMAYVTPFLASLLLWFEWGKTRFQFQPKHWLPIFTLFGIVVLAYVFRTWALQGPGFRFGSNGSWFLRWLSYTWGGRAATLVAQGELGGFSVALCLVGTWFLLRKKCLCGYPLLLTGAGVMVWFDWHKSDPFGTPLSFLAASSSVSFQRLPILQDSALTLLVIVLWFDFVARRDPRQIFSFAWVQLAYLPLLTAPITEHALYLPSIGWGIFFAAALDNLQRSVRSRDSGFQRWQPFVLQRIKKSSHSLNSASEAKETTIFSCL